EEVESALAWHRQERLDRMTLALEDCITVDQLAKKYGLTFEDVESQVTSRAFASANLGEAGVFIPTWQFDETAESEGKVAMRPEIALLWKRSNMKGLSFCEFMIRPWRGTGKTPLDLVNKGEAETVEEIGFILEHPSGLA
ncbi:MAG: hypothetical protein M3Q36_02410, partial [bacterium]|nr:hypothetical protein [bacterium]